MNNRKRKNRINCILCEILLYSMFFLFTTTPTHAGNDEGPYLTLTGAINIYEDLDLSDVGSGFPDNIVASGSTATVDLGAGFSHSIGYSFGSAFSMEVEFSSQGANWDRACSSSGCGTDASTKLQGDVETKSLLLNAIHHFNIDHIFTPYVGYGIGTAFHEATLSDYTDGAQTTFAYQLKLGIDMEMTQHINLLTGYRFLTTDEPDFGFFKGGITTHSLEAGIKYNI